MSCYSLDHVIQECIHEHLNVKNTARGKSSAAKVEIYAQAWLALNAWIESRISKHKGAAVSGFGTFCWEMLEKDGETHCRPLFLPQEEFIKVHRVKRQRIHHAPQLTPVEEVNYSLLAIRYSKNLTKDMVYTGIRDIIKKIGDYISRGYELEVDFTIGTLCAKENKIKFIFSQSRLLEILPENLEPDVLARDLSPMRYVTDEGGDAQSQSTREQDPANNSKKNNGINKTVPLPAIGKQRPFTAGMTVPRLPLSGRRPLSRSVESLTNQASGNNGKKPTVVPSLALSFGGATGVNNEEPMRIEVVPQTNNNDHGIAMTSSPQQHRLDTADEAPEDLRDVLDALGKRELKLQKDAWREEAKARVEAQAYARCLEELENAASKDDQRRYEERRQVEQWRDTIVQDREKSTDQVMELKTALHDQMELNRQRAERERIEQKNSVISYIFAKTSPTGEEMNVDGTINSRQSISKDLEGQIKANADRRERQKREALQRERDYMNRLALESEMQAVLERTKHLEKQKSLLQAWERDGHIRNLKKLQSYGTNTVKDYIDRNLATPPTSAGAFAPTLSRSLKMSIGYDPRTSKAT